MPRPRRLSAVSVLIAAALLSSCSSGPTAETQQGQASTGLQPTPLELRNLSRLLNGQDAVPCESAGDLSNPDNEDCDPLGRFDDDDLLEIQSVVEGTGVVSWGYSTEPLGLRAYVEAGAEIPEESVIANPTLPTIRFEEIEVADSLDDS